MIRPSCIRVSCIGQLWVLSVAELVLEGVPRFILLGAVDNPGRYVEVFWLGAGPPEMNGEDEEDEIEPKVENIPLVPGPGKVKL